MAIDIGMDMVNAWAWKGQDKSKPGTTTAGGEGGVSTWCIS
jgi:hypothetical protein